MRRMLPALAMLLWLCLFSVPGLAESTSRALLIGCDRFLSMEDTSPVSANNVGQMAQVLTGGSVNTENLVTRRSGVSGADELRELIALAYEGSEAGDTCYFYLSTHGLWTPEQANADVTFLLSDGRTEEGVTARELRRMLDTVQGRKVVLLDACHAGAAIGKGVSGSYANVFTGGDYVVICSSGGNERSWFWSSGEEGTDSQPGSGYFSGAVAMGMSSLGGFAADSNGDGAVTLSELKRYLRAHDGASTVQTYPEESGLAVLTYDAEAFDGRSRSAVLDRLTFEEGALTDGSPDAVFSFTVLRETKLAYLLVSYAGDGWDFASARLVWDEGDEDGLLRQGYHERSLSLSELLGGDSGYVLLELITWQDEQPLLSGSHLICLAPASGDPELSVTAERSFLPGTGDELGFTVYHAFPCELTLTVVDSDGQTVRRLRSSAATRPDGSVPDAETCFWDGLCQDGTEAPQGTYRILVRATVGGQSYEVLSEDFRLVRTAEITPRTAEK